MTGLDGNAIGGQLLQVFGAELTAATGTCAGCNACGPLAEADVYLRAPGTIARCRRCHSWLLVLVEIRGVTCVDLRGLADLDAPAPSV